MSATLQMIILFFTVLLAYLWLASPSLSLYSLQIFSLTVFLYFVVKKMSQRKLLHLAPTAHTIEVSLFVFAILILVGSTGGLVSPLFPLIYISIFFLSFTTNILISISTTLLILYLFIGLDQQSVTTSISTILMMVITNIFFLFAKKQYQEARYEQKIINQEEKALSFYEGRTTYLAHFLKTFISPKLTQIKNMTSHITENKNAITGQINLLQIQIEKLLNQVENTTIEETSDD